MKKKNIALLLSFVMVAALEGCSSSDASTEAKSDMETDEAVTLTVMDAQAYGLEVYDDLAKSFEESHPGVKIEIQHAANDYEPLLKSRVNSNDIPDIFTVMTGTMAQSYYEYANDWSKDTDVLKEFDELALDTGKDAEGNIKSLPWIYENMGLLYNKDLFEQAGITELPTTMSEFEEVCKKLDDADITAIALAAKETWVLGQLNTHFLLDKSLDAAGTVEAMYDGSLTYEMAPNYKNLYKFLDLAVKYGPEKPLEIDWEISENMLANNEAAIIHMGDWCQATLDKFNPEANLGFLPFPVSDNPEDTIIQSTITWTYIVNKDSENLELAKEFLNYTLTSEKGLDWMCNTIGAVPPVAGEHKVSGQLANDAGQYIAAGETNGSIYPLYPSGYWESTVGPTLQSYMLGDTSMEDAIEVLQANWVGNK